MAASKWSLKVSIFLPKSREAILTFTHSGVTSAGRTATAEGIALGLASKTIPALGARLPPGSKIEVGHDRFIVESLAGYPSIRKLRGR